MSVKSRLTKVFNKSPIVHFDDNSKIIFMSDCHRSNGSNADNFSKNRPLFTTALKYYYDNDYTYVEVGDGDELWENKKAYSIVRENIDVYKLLTKFYEKNRLHLIYGNHDMHKKNCRYYDEIKQKDVKLFEDLKIEEGIVFVNDNQNIFVVHGHQGDLFNDRLWFINRFLVRYIWKPLELIGVKNPLGFTYNPKKKTEVEKKIIDWVSDNNQMIICGHTHRIAFPRESDALYFNDGSCVSPHMITGIEISNGSISLVKWSIKSKLNGLLYVGKDVLEGPVLLKKYF